MCPGCCAGDCSACMTRLWRDRSIVFCLYKKGALGPLLSDLVGSVGSAVVRQIDNDSKLFEGTLNFAVLKDLVFESIALNDQAVLFAKVVDLEFSLNVLKIADVDFVFDVVSTIINGEFVDDAIDYNGILVGSELHC